MPSAAAATFNSVPTLGNLVKLAQQSPKEARAAVNTVAEGLKNAALPADLRTQLESILAAQDVQLSAVLQNSTLFKSIFPDGGGDFASCVAAASKPESIGWTADSTPPRVAFTGQVSREADSSYVLTTASGRRFTLTATDLASKINPGMSPGWLEGFIADGSQPLTVQGTLGADGKSVRVEGYCPGSSGDFVFGRVKLQHPLTGAIERMAQPPTAAERQEIIQSGRVYVQTTRGDIEVTNPKFRELLAHLPRLGVILPLEPTTLPDGKQVIDQNPDYYFALGGRFAANTSSPATDLGGGVWQTNGNFAYDNFKGQVTAPGDAAKWRMENNGGQRNWLGGQFVLGADGELARFEAKYLSTDLGEFQLPASNVASGDASATQNLLASAEVIDAVPNDFQRTMAPPG